MMSQFIFLIADYKRLIGRKKIRLLYIWMSQAGIALIVYRFERGMYLGLGWGWEILRVLLLPVLNLLYAYTNCDIHYKTDIGPGLLVLHPSVGVVVSGKFVIGKRLTLTGGNTIGSKVTLADSRHRIGDDCTLGANAVIIGPVIIGNNVQIGAMALVNKNAEDGAILVGVPAKNIAKNTPVAKS